MPETRHLEIIEQDLIPDVLPVHKITVPNSSLVDNGDGSVDMNYLAGIGNPIVGGTANSVLFIDSSGNLAEDNPGFTYIPATGLSLDDGLTAAGTVTFTSITNDRLVRTNASSELVEVDNLSNFVAGTTNQVAVVDDGDGSITLSLPQSIAITNSPQFVGLRLTGLTQNSVLFAGASGDISQENDNFNYVASTNRQGIGTGFTATAPVSTLHLRVAAFGGTAPSTTGLTIESNDSAEISLLGANDETSSIFFGDPQDTDVGRIRYAHDGDTMKFTAGAATFATGTATGLGLGTTTSPDEALEIGGVTDATMKFSSSDTTIADAAIIGSIEFETADLFDPGIAAKINVVAVGTQGEMAISFLTGTAMTLLETMRITENQRVLVGTGTDPQDRLHVFDASDDMAIRIETSKTNGSAQIRFHNDADSFRMGIFGGSGDAFLLVNDGTSRIIFNIDDNSPANTLVIFNGETIWNSSGANWDFRIEGDSQDHLFFLDAGVDTITVGSGTSLAMFGVDGFADEIQFLVQGHSTQNANLIVAEQSDGTDVFTVSNSGEVDINGALTLSTTTVTTTSHTGSISNESRRSCHKNDKLIFYSFINRLVCTTIDEESCMHLNKAVEITLQLVTLTIG